MTDRREEFLRVLLGHLGAVEDVAQIAPDANLRTLGLNSMRAVDLVMDLEDAFDFTFPDSAFTDEVFATADGIWAVVAAHLPDRVES
ncbi:MULTISPECIES: phosphopantetheine-binding protein [Actinomadura]|uniref:Phosphopantetheine-binding protein n=1 Tax=Actinomadura yumaensis TaxID=111807 RepID=A0ABW2CYW4_9ACTN|nr:phosphopantetheine-binding protein [Actinomadura sp. J1-007]MWK38912.1 acyl carrier protein [Actinomadura sp. J1-007]